VFTSKFCKGCPLYLYMEICQNVGPDITAQSISVEPSCVFKKLQIQDLNFTIVNAPCSTDTKDGSTCDSLQLLNSISLHWTGIFYCVIWLRTEILRSVKVTVWGNETPYNLVDNSLSWHQFGTCLTNLHGVTFWTTVTVTFNVFEFTSFRNR
jgi:hypothetical protein